MADGEDRLTTKAARACAALRPALRALGLSIGGRACLALAQARTLPMLRTSILGGLGRCRKCECTRCNGQPFISIDHGALAGWGARIPRPNR